jgi:hypothetical protein
VARKLQNNLRKERKKEFAQTNWREGNCKGICKKQGRRNLHKGTCGKEIAKEFARSKEEGTLCKGSCW